MSKEAAFSLLLSLIVLAGGLLLVPTARAVDPVEVLSVQSTQCVGASCTSVQWTHVATSTDSTMFIVGISITESAGSVITVSSITYDDGFGPVDQFEQMMSVRAGPPLSTQALAEMWRLEDFQAGVMGTITVTTTCDLGCGVGHNVIGGSVFLGNVNSDQVLNLGVTTVSDTGNFGLGGGTVSASPVAHGVSDLIVDIVAVPSDSVTTGTNQTLRWDEFSAQGFGAMSSAPEGSTVSWTTDQNGPAALIATSVRGQAGGGGDDGGGVGSIRVPKFPSSMEPRCELGVLDWLVPSKQPGSTTVSIQDLRPEAVLVTQYVINWGDNRADIVSSLPINHTYSQEDIYKITMAVSYRSGAIEVFVALVDVRGNNCSLQMFMSDFGPLLLGLVALLVLSATIVTVVKFRIEPKRKRSVRKVLLSSALLILLAIFVILIYAFVVGIPLD